MRPVLAAILLLWLLTLPALADGTFSGHALFEYQLGNLPDTRPDDLSTLVSRFNLAYRLSDFRGSLRFESFTHPETDPEFHRMTQFLFRYRKNGIEVKAGHFYDIIGRGLLLRAYEIPGAVQEDAAFRVRHGFYRDIQGVAVKVRSQVFEVKALYGRPLAEVLPPTLDRPDRRPDLVEAVEAKWRLKTISIGSGILRHQHDGPSTFATLFASGSPFGNVSFYLEWAQAVGDAYRAFATDDASRYGLYGSLSWANRAVGISMEVKDYHRLFIGSGINDPPPLVKEHSYILLNRSTHVVFYDDERGYQLEGFARLPGSILLTLNHAHAQTELDRIYTFYEYFGELQVPFARGSQAKVFFDWARDEFKQESNRFSTGLSYEQPFSGVWSALVKVEVQTFRNTLLDKDDILNSALAFSLSKGSSFSISGVWERSTDPLFTDRIDTFEAETAPRHWLSGTLNWTVHPHRFSLFFGSRRGGPACTSGICREILDFEGVELRWTTRF